MLVLVSGWGKRNLRIWPPGHIATPGTCYIWAARPLPILCCCWGEVSLGCGL